METFYPYIFRFKNGLPPEIAKQKRENEAFELFMRNLLGEDGYKKRNQMRFMEKAVSTIVDEILMSQN
jgi:hypothetical protein